MNHLFSSFFSTTMSLDLSLCQNSRRVAFITGAARGIGLAIALRLSQDGLDVGLVQFSYLLVSKTPLLL